MKLLLVRPKNHRETIGINNLMLTEPLDLMYVAGAFKADKSVTINVIDMNIERKSLNFYLATYNPDIVGFTSYIVHVNMVSHYAKIVKEWNKNAVKKGLYV